jgi:hypothetical protein
MVTICLAVAAIQLVLAFVMSAYHNVNLKVDSDTVENEEEALYYKSNARATIKVLMRVQFFEGVLVEILMIFLTGLLEYDLQVILLG